MYTFRKNEKLCSFRQKNTLFGQGKAFFQYPFRVVYYCFPEKEAAIPEHDASPNPADHFVYPARWMVSVPRKRFKKAVDRNRIKRLAREGYRHNKTELYSFLQSKKLLCLLAFIYTGKEIAQAAEIRAKISLSLHKLMEYIGNDYPDPTGA